MNDQPSRRLDPRRAAEIEALRRALIEGEESGDAGPLDMAEIIRRARGEAGLGPADA
ncbi:MAG TPA: type II toxin-antitoxin system ParD family antitoxin [Allosphingosinicella sp.]|jgi:Arc/MetJ-type ribon-helix-helix transcriptional regulator